MATITLATKSEPILEYVEHNDNNSLIIEDSYPMISSNQKKWIFPWRTISIDTGLEIWIPKGHVGIIIKNESSLNPNLQLDTIIIYDSAILNIRIKNRGWLPVKITEEDILAHLLIVPITECHIINTEGQS